MINPDTPTFPNNAVEVMLPYFGQIDDDLTVVRRMLRPSDADHMIGVFPALWQPEGDDPYEMGHPFSHEPTLQTYQIGVQTLVKHGDSEVGLKLHCVIAQLVRTVLYKNEGLRQAIGGLSITVGSVTERVLRWEVRLQRMIGNEIEGTFVFVSVAEVLLTTETGGS